MKNCGKANCTNQIKDKYTYCYEHYVPGTGTKPVTTIKAPGQWHDDPVVDQLMKINNNLKRIGDLLGGTKKEMEEPFLAKEELV